MGIRFPHVFSVALLCLPSGGLLAQDESDFCGQAGAMVIDVDPILSLDTTAMAYADNDSVALQQFLAAGFDDAFVNEVRASEMQAVLFGFGTALLVSSADVARSFLGDDADCGRLTIVALD